MKFIHFIFQFNSKGFITSNQIREKYINDNMLLTNKLIDEYVLFVILVYINIKSIKNQKQLFSKEEILIREETNYIFNVNVHLNYKINLYQNLF